MSGNPGLRQACRSMPSVSRRKNEDRGFVIETFETFGSFGATFEVKTNEHKDKCDYGHDIANAIGTPYLSLEEEQTQSSVRRRTTIQRTSLDMKKTELKRFFLNTRSEHEGEFPPVETDRLCDNSIILFSSMSGKYSYSKTEGQHMGGWLIVELFNALKKYQQHDKVDILEVFTAVNDLVSKREGGNLFLAIESMKLKSHIKSDLYKLYTKYMDKLFDLCDYYIPKKAEFMETFQVLKNEIDDQNLGEHVETIYELIDMIEKAPRVEFTAQSCFEHNLCLEEENIYLLRKTTL